MSESKLQRDLLEIIAEHKRNMMTLKLDEQIAKTNKAQSEAKFYRLLGFREFGKKWDS